MNDPFIVGLICGLSFVPTSFLLGMALGWFNGWDERGSITVGDDE